MVLKIEMSNLSYQEIKINSFFGVLSEHLRLISINWSLFWVLIFGIIKYLGSVIYLHNLDVGFTRL